MGSILLNHAMLYMLIWLDITCGAYKITTKLNFFYFPCICQLIQVFLGNYENNKHVHNHSWNGQDDFSFQIFLFLIEIHFGCQIFLSSI